jgi:hypothetical protein
MSPETRIRTPAVPGTYRFEAGSAAEAVAAIQARLGAEARVLSVSARPPRGIARLWAAPRFEVVAELPAPQPLEEVAREFVSPGPALALQDGTRLPSLLRRAGFPERLLGRLEASPGWTRALSRPLHEGLADLRRDLRSAVSAPRPLPRSSAGRAREGRPRSASASRTKSSGRAHKAASGGWSSVGRIPHPLWMFLVRLWGCPLTITHQAMVPPGHPKVSCLLICRLSLLPVRRRTGLWPGSSMPRDSKAECWF